MSEQIERQQPSDNPLETNPASGWEEVAGVYKEWHPGLHPFVEGQLAAHGISHVPEAQESDPDVPNCEQLLNDIVTATDDPIMRRSLRAERRHESTPELDTIFDTIIGIKLNALASGDTELFANAETVLLESYRSGEPKTALVEQGLKQAREHDEVKRKFDKPLTLDEELSNYRNHLTSMGMDEASMNHKLGLHEYHWNKANAPERLSVGNLAMVHATNYLPRRHESDSLLHIGSQFDDTGLSRNTVHVALNHMVESSPMSNNWSDKQFIIVAPLDKVIEINGNPTSMIAHDTWWETRPNKGITLPEDTIIVRPGASGPIYVDKAGHEVRYKSHGITATDIDDLCEQAGGYELMVNSQILGLKLESESPGIKYLGDTELKQQVTELNADDRQQLALTLQELLGSDRGKAEAIFADIAKRFAVRRALELQGREVVEPMTVMSGGEFMSEEISQDLLKLRRRLNIAGMHHSNTTVYGLEKMVANHMLGSNPNSANERNVIRQQIKNHADELSIATLQMYYRLGLF